MMETTNSIGTCWKTTVEAPDGGDTTATAGKSVAPFRSLSDASEPLSLSLEVSECRSIKSQRWVVGANGA
jgi:hypothetical protein